MITLKDASSRPPPCALYSRIIYYIFRYYIICIGSRHSDFFRVGFVTPWDGIKLYVGIHWRENYKVRFNLNYCVYHLLPFFYRRILNYRLGSVFFSFYRDCYRKTLDFSKKKFNLHTRAWNDLRCSGHELTVLLIMYIVTCQKKWHDVYGPRWISVMYVYI